MKIILFFKTPEAVEYAIEAATEHLVNNEEIREEVKEEVKEEITDTIRNAAAKYVEYGECVRIELDTDTGTAKVLET